MNLQGQAREAKIEFMASPSIAFMGKETARTGQGSKIQVYGQSFYIFL